MGSILSLDKVVKRYSNHLAVDNVSFEMPKGCIFGLLGPNGAGKTSLIRIITTITGADQGEILLDGEKLNVNHPGQIGYLPEERGLYKKMKVGDQLMYLAQLKGLSEIEAKKRLKTWLEKWDMSDWWTKKIEELSKGMQQKVQFIATIVHEPKLIILDEPFSGLDPINTNLIKDTIYDLHSNGTSVIFSTHRMEQVEEICEHIVLINKGKKILEGEVEKIKDDFKENKYKIGFNGNMPPDIIPESFEVIEDSQEELVIKVQDGHKGNELLKALIDKGIDIRSYNEVLPTLNEIFIKQVGDSNE